MARNPNTIPSPAQLDARARELRMTIRRRARNSSGAPYRSGGGEDLELILPAPVKTITKLIVAGLGALFALSAAIFLAVWCYVLLPGDEAFMVLLMAINCGAGGVAALRSFVLDGLRPLRRRTRVMVSNLGVSVLEDAQPSTTVKADAVASLWERQRFLAEEKVVVHDLYAVLEDRRKVLLLGGKRGPAAVRLVRRILEHQLGLEVDDDSPAQSPT